MTRAEATALGHKVYFTGRPCKNGHLSVRRTVSGVCNECAKAYQLQPHVAERKRENAKRYARANPEKTKARILRWRAANRDRVNGYNNKWKEDNLELVRSQAKIAAREWRKNNPRQRAYQESLRRARKLMATPPWADLEEVRWIYANCPPGHHVDHIVPLRHHLVCGLHVPWNLQYLPSAENVRKHNEFNGEFWSQT